MSENKISSHKLEFFLKSDTTINNIKEFYEKEQPSLKELMETYPMNSVYNKEVQQFLISKIKGLLERFYEDSLLPCIQNDHKRQFSEYIYFIRNTFSNCELYITTASYWITKMYKNKDKIKDDYFFEELIESINSHTYKCEN